ncbi:hypothetical protein EDB83DRAFT_1240724 [Lactarius deliciosus]|nr:hypothetical protein EDB83DRAFT_1240724 [Lactarius deliciosus]
MPSAHHLSPLLSALQLTSARSTVHSPVTPASPRTKPTRTARLHFICHSSLPFLAPPTIPQKAATSTNGPEIYAVPEQRTAMGMGEPGSRD